MPNPGRATEGQQSESTYQHLLYHDFFSLLFLDFRGDTPETPGACHHGPLERLSFERCGDEAEQFLCHGLASSSLRWLYGVVDRCPRHEAKASMTRRLFRHESNLSD